MNLFVLLFLTASALAAPRQIPAEPPVELIGERVSVESLELVEGGELVLGSKPVVLVFWNRTCRSCFSAFPELESWQRTSSVDLYFVSVDRDPVVARAMAGRMKTSVPIALDSQAIVMGEQLLYALPTILVLDKDGKLRKQIVGFRSEETLVELEEAINGL